MKVDLRLSLKFHPSLHKQLVYTSQLTIPSLRHGSQALLTFLATDVDCWEGHSNPTDARLHFGVWSLGGNSRWKGGEVLFVHEPISWARLETTFSDRERRRQLSCRGRMHLEPQSSSPIFPFVGFPKVRGSPQASQRRPQVAVFPKRPLHRRWLGFRHRFLKL